MLVSLLIGNKYIQLSGFDNILNDIVSPLQEVSTSNFLIAHPFDGTICNKLLISITHDQCRKTMEEYYPIMITLIFTSNHVNITTINLSSNSL